MTSQMLIGMVFGNGSQPGAWRRSHGIHLQAGGGDQGLEVAGRYASGVIGATYTIEDAREPRVGYLGQVQN